MANVEKRTTQDNKVTYRVKVRLKGFPTQTATFERLTDARKWAQHTESAIREGRHFKTTEAKRHTLAESIDRYVQNVLPTKPNSARCQAQQLSWWKEAIGSYSLADLTPALIAQQKEKLGQGITSRSKPRSTATVNRYLAALSHVFTIGIVINK